MKAILALTLITAAPAAAQEAGPLDWMAGAWCTEAGAEGQSCERWSAQAGGMMLGTSQTVKDGRTSGFEFLRITFEDGAVYHAQPGGAPPVAFREARRERQLVTFENAANDYPQRIRYWREGEALRAEISMLDGAKAMGWSFRRMEQ